MPGLAGTRPETAALAKVKARSRRSSLPCCCGSRYLRQRCCLRRAMPSLAMQRRSVRYFHGGAHTDQPLAAVVRLGPQRRNPAKPEKLDFQLPL
jgi:hypothetical protein